MVGCYLGASRLQKLLGPLADKEGSARGRFVSDLKDLSLATLWFCDLGEAT